MATTKTPSQYASGADTFSDNLVGFQIVDGVSQMTNTSFAVDRVIPEKDTKTFHTQPFSDFLTLDNISKEESQKSTVSTTASASTSTSSKIKFYDAKDNAAKSMFGSLSSRLKVSVQSIIIGFPAALYVDSSSPIKSTNLTAESIIYDAKSKTTNFQFQISLLFNPFDIVLVEPKSNTPPETKNTIRNFYSSYTKYVLDLNGVSFGILNYTEDSVNNKIYLQVNGDCFSGATGYTESYLIRPNNGIVEEFYNSLDELEIILMDRETLPKYQAPFKVPRDLNGGASTEIVTEVVIWPLTKDNWNPQIMGIDFDYYLEQLVSIGEDIDNYKSNLIVRFLTAPQLFEFDTPDQKYEAINQIFGQSFDQVKKFIDNIAFMRNVTYDKINNVPDILLKNLATTLGLNTINLFDEKSLQDSLYTRNDTQYIGLNIGKNLVETEYEFYRRILVNLAQLFKSKGTRMAIEFFLKFIGAPEPIIRFDEYIYRLDNPLPKATYEKDIREAIQGNYISYTAVYTGDTPTSHIIYAPYMATPPSIVPIYFVTGTTGSTTLTRDEYPVDPTTGLPRGMQSSDGSLFFEMGSGWYRKTIDHRSHDILDTDNSSLTGRTKTIKTMSKPFTYGEDYFDYYRKLPGLDYGFDLTSEIDNLKGEVINTDAESRYIMNRKNVNVFLSSDRGIDFDIYTKSRNLSLTFGTLPPQTGVTFAEFLSSSLSEVIKNSNTVKYERYYYALDDVYNSYKDNVGFTPYNYIKVNEFIERMGPYWVEIIDQFVPATTLWLGGNVIENGTFNRSKFFYKKHCTPVEFSETLFPDFNNVVEEDLETILGGGTMKGVDVAVTNLRGLFTFSGLTYILYLDVNGNIFTGTTEPITNELFTGFTPSAACTSLTDTTSWIPLICEYKDWINPNIPAIKVKWLDGIQNLVDNVNASSGESGVSMTFEIFTDVNGIERIKFVVQNGACVEGGKIDFYFEPLYNVPKDNCDLQVLVSTSGAKYTGDLDCILKTDLFIKITKYSANPDDPQPDIDGGFVSGIEENNALPINFFITSGTSCTGGTLCSDCNPAYTWEQYTGNRCYTTLTTGATAPSTVINLAPYGYLEYSRSGTKVFNTSFHLDGTGTIIKTLNTTNVWRNLAINSSDGPMNRCSLWTTQPGHRPFGTWVGFSTCLTGMISTKTYYIGIAADNHYRLSLDGVTILDTSSRTVSTEMFLYWHLYPVEIGAGTHVMELFGLNVSDEAGFGCEIYDNTFDEITGATQYSDLSVVFTSSGVTEATVVQTQGGTYTSSGYTCPPGYAYSSCSGICTKTLYCDSDPQTGATFGDCTECTFDEVDITPILTTSSGCTFMLSGVSETDIYDIIVADAANCEQKIRIEGLSPQIIDVNGTTGYTIHPKVQYKTTYNYGLKKGSVVYKEVRHVPIIVWENFRDAITNGDIVEVLIDNVKVGDILYSIAQKPISQIPLTEFTAAFNSNDSFDFTFFYRRITITQLECLSSIKKSTINNEFVVLPTTKVYVYSNIDVNLAKVPYRFTYKYPEDLYIKSPVDPGPPPCCHEPKNFVDTSDYLVDQYGFLIEVTSVDLNYCDRGIFYVMDFIESPGSLMPHPPPIDNTPNVILFNGMASGSTRIIVSYLKEEFKCMDMGLQQYFINAICDTPPTVEDLERDGCNVGECTPSDCIWDANFIQEQCVGCLSEMRIIVDYNITQQQTIIDNTTYPAKFNLYANDTLLGQININNTGVDDFYNYPPDENSDTYYPESNHNRYNVIGMSPEQAKTISDIAEDGVVEFRIECAYPDINEHPCNEGITHIQLIRNESIIYDGYPLGNIVRINPCSGAIYE